MRHIFLSFATRKYEDFFRSQILSFFPREKTKDLAFFSTASCCVYELNLRDIKALEDLIVILEDMPDYKNEEKQFYITEFVMFTKIKNKQNYLEQDLKFLVDENNKMLDMLNLI